MAGGTWQSQNKGRPGAYINFIGVPKPLMTVGDRGIACIPLELSWGSEEEFIDVYSTELLSGDSLSKIGFTAFDVESKRLNLLLQGCYLAKIFRLNKNGVKASATAGDLKITAKYSGSFGNKILVAVSQVGTLYEVITYVNGEVKDKQKVGGISELIDNDFVVFVDPSGGTGNIEVTAGTALIGGTDGTVSTTTAYPEYFRLLSIAKFQTAAFFAEDDTDKKNFRDFIKSQRDDEGRYIQGVVANDTSADYEGIINVANGLVVYGEKMTAYDMIAWVTGVTAGARITDSNTGKVVEGATSIIGEMNNEEIITALQNGKFLFSTNTDGTIKVEQDINSLHNFTQKKGYAFSKNRVTRILDEIGTTTKVTFEKSYMGKVNNDENGRMLFKGDMVSYTKTLQQLGAVQNFDSAKDIDVLAGAEIDSFLCNYYIQPVDSMEKLYMTVRVGA